MPVDTFDEFVKQRTDRAKQFANYEETLATWQHELGSLYDIMEGYLKNYTESGQIRTERRSVQLTEDYLGSYEAQALAVLIGNDEVIAQPVGALVIGSSGRVDLSGPRRMLRIVLIEKSGSAMNVTTSGADSQEETSTRSLLPSKIDHRGWYFVTPPPDSIATALGEGSFRNAIMDVAGA